MASELVKTIALLIVFLIAGAACGIMFNVALGRKFSELGGIVGGLVVGALMWLL